MLGNKYFLARNYKGAAENFQHTLQTDPINKAIRKKLIICYTQIGQIQKAFDNFYKLVREDINFVIETDLVAEDCPCPELIAKYGTVLPYESGSSDMKLMLAMLWLYCSVTKSLGFFQQVLFENTGDYRIKEVISLIKDQINTSNKLTH